MTERSWQFLEPAILGLPYPLLFEQLAPGLPSELRRRMAAPVQQRLGGNGEPCSDRGMHLVHDANCANGQTP
jgi:hypothetical protein